MGTDIQECKTKGKYDGEIKRDANHESFSFAAYTSPCGHDKALTTNVMDKVY